MTDKKHTLLVILDSPDVSEEAKKLMDALVKDGNTQMLVLRKASLSEQFGLFEAITSLS